MSLFINSFPRTGNRYLLNFLNRFLHVDNQVYNSDTMHDFVMIQKPTPNQIVIIRDPKDTIPSFAILKKEVEGESGDTMAYAIDNWLEWHEYVLVNIKNLYPFTFDQVSSDPISCLLEIARIFSYGHADEKEMRDFKYNLMKDGLSAPVSIRQSSKLSPNYDKVKEEYEAQDPEILSVIEEMYQDLLVAVFKRQKALSIVV